MNLRFGAATDQGRARRQNEDCFVADGDLRLFAVVDGMGGHASGELASATIAEGVTAFIRETAGNSDKTWPSSLDVRLSALANRLQVAIRSANRILATRAQTNAALDGSGATLAAALFSSDQLAVSNVGDCRAYLHRKGQLSQITRDHPLRHVVTRAISGQADLAVDTLELEVEAGDRLLLCSDGIHAVLTDKEIAEFLSDHVVTLEQICQAAIDLANARGGLDNSTVVIIEAT